MRKVTLFGIMFILTSACNVSPTSDAASTGASGNAVATNETHYCHDDIKLREKVRRGDGSLTGPTVMVTKADVKVVVSGDSASVSVGGEFNTGYKCVKYHGIPLDDEFTFKNLSGAEGLTGKGFKVVIHDSDGLNGEAASIEWAETAGKGRGLGADILFIQIGNGMYNSRPGESLYTATSHCPSASQEDSGSDEKKTSCVEYEYQQEEDGKYSWLPKAQD